MVLLPFLTFEIKNKTKSFVILFLSPGSRLTGRQPPFFMREKNVYYVFIFSTCSFYWCKLKIFF